MSRLATLLALTAFLLFSPGHVMADQDEQPPRIALLPLEMIAPQEMSHLQDGIRTMLGSRLAATQQAALVSRSTVERELAAVDPPQEADDYAALGRRLKADYLIGGVLTAVGSGLSLDLNVYDIRADGRARAFSTSAASEDEVIPMIDELAGDITESVLAPATPPATGQTAAPSPVIPGTQQPSYISPHPQRQLLESMAPEPQPESEPALEPTPESSSSIIRGSETNRLRGDSKSQEISLDLRAMEAADVTGDGRLEFILAGPNRVEIYRREENRFIRMGRINTLNRYPIHYLSTADLNGNGRAEIYISAADHRRPNSLIVEWNGNDFVRTHDNLSWYIRAMELPMEGETLVGQRAGGGSFLRSGLFRLHSADDGNLEAGAPLSLPGRLNLFDFALADLDGNGSHEIITITQGERLEVLSAGGGRLWRSNNHYGGTTRYLGGRESADAARAPHEVEQHYVPSRIVLRDVNLNGRPEVVVTQSNPTLSRSVGQVRYYSSGEIHALSWDGSGMDEIWRTRNIEGYIADIQLGPDIRATDDDGETRRGAELFVGVKNQGGGLNLFSKDTSTIHVYPVEYQETREQN